MRTLPSSEAVTKVFQARFLEKTMEKGLVELEGQLHAATSKNAEVLARVLHPP